MKQSKRQWTAEQRKAQGDKLRAYHAARKRGTVPTEQRLRETRSAHSTLRNELIKDIADSLHSMNDVDLLGVYRKILNGGLK